VQSAEGVAIQAGRFSKDQVPSMQLLLVIILMVIKPSFIIVVGVLGFSTSITASLSSGPHGPATEQECGAKIS
jgi:hypothetical protein